MSIVYYHKRLNSLILDWMLLRGDGQRYGGAMGAAVGYDPDIVGMPLAADTDISLWESVSKLCGKAGTQKLVLLHLFEYMGPQRSANLVRKLNEMTDGDCCISLGGPVEVACGEVLRQCSQSGTPVLKLTMEHDGAKSAQQDCRVPIGVDVSLDEGPVRQLASMLKAVGVEDTIEVLLRGQTQRRFDDRGEPDWVVTVGPGSTGSALLDIVANRVEHLKCTGVALSKDALGSGLWPDSKALVSWVKSLHQRDASVTITIIDSPLAFDRSVLKELRQYGVRKFCMQLSPSDLSPQGIESACRMLDTCIQCEIAPAVIGNPGTRAASWSDLRRMWALCDRLGLDFIEMLGATPCTGKNGWCGDVCELLSQSSSLFFQYRRANTHIKIAEQHPEGSRRLHSSALSFYRTKKDQVCNCVLGELSNYAVLQSDCEIIRQVAQEAADELVEISEKLSGAAGESRQETYSAGTISPDGGRCDTAVVVVASNNASHLRLCLTSISLYTDRCYDLFVVDCGNLPCSCVGVPSPGRFVYEHLPRQRLLSFATAWGLNKARAYDYILILDSNACALKADWLNEMIAELEQDPGIGAVGLRYDELDYQKNENAARLLSYVLSPDWQMGLGLDSPVTGDDLTRMLSAKDKTCFAELTGWIQLYKGDVLRRIGLPIVDHRLLKHNHWDSELSMRAVACGYDTVDSPAAREKLHFFGKRLDSGIPGVSSYVHYVEDDRNWLAENGYDELALLLKESQIDSEAGQPSYCGWAAANLST